MRVSCSVLTLHLRSFGFRGFPRKSRGRANREYDPTARNNANVFAEEKQRQQNGDERLQSGGQWGYDRCLAIVTIRGERCDHSEAI